MGRQSRVYSESKIYHIMFRGVNYQDLFEERQDYIKLTETILLQFIVVVKKSLKVQLIS